MAGKGTQGRLDGWWPKVKAELTPRKDLLLLKIILSLQLFSTSSAGSYFIVFMQQLGITYSELATIAACQPITSVLGPFVSGLVADKTGHYKVVICFNIVMTAVMTLLLGYAPARPPTALSLTCASDGHAFTWDHCDLCHHQHHNNTPLNLVLMDCVFSCSSPPDHMQLCFTGNHTTCIYLNATSEVALNGTTMLSDRCSPVWSEVRYNDDVFRNMTCPAHCPIHCQVSTPPTCPNPTHLANNPTTFWAILTGRLLWVLFLSSYYFMMDATTLAMIKERGGDFGKQRILPIIAGSIAPPITGALVDWYSTGRGHSDYTPAMVLSAAVAFVSAALVTRLRFTVEHTENRMAADLKKLMTRKEVDALFVLAFALGANWGFIATYLFPYLRILQAPNSVMGMAVLVGNLAAVPVIFIGDRIVGRFGCHTIFITAFFVYAFREFIYTLFSDPWAVVGVEIVKVLSLNLPWITMVRLCPVLAPKGLLATMSGTLGPMHYTFGSSAGSFVGGHLVSALGLVGAFRTFSYMSLGCGGLYLILYFCYIRRRMQGGEDVEEAAPMMGLRSADNHIITPADNTTPVKDDKTTTLADNCTITPADTHTTTTAESLTTTQADSTSTTQADSTSTTQADSISSIQADSISTTQADTISTTQADTISTTQADTISTTPAKNASTIRADNYTSTTPADNHTTTPADNYIKTPADNHTTTPAENHTTAPAENHTTAPAENHTTTPADNHTKTSTENHDTKPADNHTTTPTENHTTTSAESHTTPADNSTTTPTDSYITVPADNHTTTPADKSNTMQADNHTTTPDDNTTTPNDNHTTISVDTTTTISADTTTTISADTTTTTPPCTTTPADNTT